MLSRMLIIGFAFSWALVFSIHDGTDAGLQIDRLRCENKDHPVGVGPNPKLSWTLKSSERGQRQTAFQILVSRTLNELENPTGHFFDSGKQPSEALSYRALNLTAFPGQTFFWKIRVWDSQDRSSRWSAPNSFSTGLFSREDWGNAEWIAMEELPDSLKLVPGVHGRGDRLGNVAKQRPIIPMFRKEFIAKKPITRAVCFVSGLGHYELYLNGKKIGDHFLSPGWTDYRKTCLYNTFDVTAQMREGENILGAIVGNGFFNINRERYRKLVIAYGMPQMILQMRIDYEDGTFERIISDSSWKTAPSPITFTSIYGGEDYDARLEQSGWCLPRFDASHWEHVRVVAGPGGQLKAESDHPVKVMQVMDVSKILQPRDSIFIYDFGQNASGIVRLTAQGPRGATIKCVPGELLGEDSLVTQKASGEPYGFSYTLKGEGVEVWQPRFSYYGFRYVQVQGGVPSGTVNPKGLPRIERLEFLHTRNSSPEVGSFQCSNPLFNRIYDLINWAIKSNLTSVATDCPHREKLGWLEQAHLMGNSIQYNYDIQPLYEKIITDMMDAQLENGLVPDIAPEFVPFEGGFRDSPEWGSAAVILPWYLFQWYGDREPIKKAYPMMNKYLLYLESKSDQGLLDHGLGDWYDLGPKSPGEAQLTPKGLTATAIYYYDLTLFVKMAELLGRSQDAALFKGRAERVLHAFQEKYFNIETQSYATGSQTSNAMPLYFRMVDDRHRPQVFRNLLDSIRQNDQALTAGDIGYRYLLRALADGGAHQLIYEMNARDDVPGYGFQLKQGATALTESWAALRYVSNNHMMLGHLMEWFFSGLVGIRQAQDSFGFGHIVIDPNPVGEITWANAHYRSVKGDIVCDWKRAGNSLLVDLLIPVQSRATLYLPAIDPDRVWEGERLAANSPGVELIGYENQRAIFRIQSGEYRFRSQINE